MKHVWNWQRSNQYMNYIKYFVWLKTLQMPVKRRMTTHPRVKSLMTSRAAHSPFGRDAPRLNAPPRWHPNEDGRALVSWKTAHYTWRGCNAKWMQFCLWRRRSKGQWLNGLLERAPAVYIGWRQVEQQSHVKWEEWCAIKAKHNWAKLVWIMVSSGK